MVGVGPLLREVSQCANEFLEQGFNDFPVHMPLISDDAASEPMKWFKFFNVFDKGFEWFTPLFCCDIVPVKSCVTAISVTPFLLERACWRARFSRGIADRNGAGFTVASSLDQGRVHGAPLKRGTHETPPLVSEGVLCLFQADFVVQLCVFLGVFNPFPVPKASASIEDLDLPGFNWVARVITPVSCCC